MNAAPFSGHKRIEEYRLMLKWGTNEIHIYDERVKLSYSSGMFDLKQHVVI